MEKIKSTIPEIILDLLRHRLAEQDNDVISVFEDFFQNGNDGFWEIEGYEIQLSDIGYEILLFLSESKLDIKFDLPDFNLFNLIFDIRPDIKKNGAFSFYLSVSGDKFFEFSNINFRLRFDESFLKPIDKNLPYSEISYGGKIRVNSNLSIQLMDWEQINFTPSEIGGTGLVLGFKGLQFDASKKSTIPAIENLGFSNSFRGLFFEEVFITVIPEKFFGGFPSIQLRFFNAVFGSNGITFRLYNYFPVFFDNNTISIEKSLAGFLLFEDWQIALESVTLDVKENSIESFGVLGYLRLPIFNLLLRIGFNITPQVDGYRINYTVFKENVENKIYNDDQSFFQIEIKELSLNGVIEKDNNVLDGKVKGKISFGDFKIELSDAQLSIVKTSTEEILTIKIESINFEGVGLFQNAVFYHRTFKEGTQTKTETYIEIKQSTDDLKTTLGLGNMPDYFPDLPSGIEASLRYYWNDLQSNLLLKVSIKDVDYLWAFIPDNFRPQVERASFVYDRISTKNSPVEEKKYLEILLSLEPLFSKLPFQEFIHIESGNDEGIIIAKWEEVGGGAKVKKTQLTISNPFSIAFDIPGLGFSQPPLFSKVQAINIVNNGKGRNKFKFEIKGYISIHPELKISRPDKLLSTIGIEKIPFVLGTLKDKNDSDVFFQLGSNQIGDFLNFNLLSQAADSFISSLTGGANISFQTKIESKIINPVKKVINNSSYSIEKTIPLHKKIGPLGLEYIHFQIPAFIELIKKSAFQFLIKLDINADIGPIHAAVKGVGLKANLKKKGNMDVGLSFDLISPSGADISLDTPLISGGGFLNKREDGYDGMLELQMKSIELLGIGIITTKMPNGKDGFSMLISINVIFFPPIQLTFGFTLAGVGGLIGINRTLKVDTLREQIASGAINSIMFPENPIENADKVISDLRSVFPPQEKHFVIAPFLKIGFGTPSIVEVDLGVVLEFPFTGRVIILGSLGVYLPVKELPLVEIHVDIIGDFNFPERYIRIEGRLNNSKVVGINLSGGFAFMLDWGRRPAFLFSIGGYHPRYKKPAKFPDIPRLSAVINLGGIVRLGCEYYQAITSNSFQIGFRAYMSVNFAGVSISAYFGFNALLQIAPLYFDVDVSLGVKLKFKGYTLLGADFYFRLSGPSPWHVIGFAKVKILIFKVKVKFNKTFGQKETVPPTYISVAELLDKVKESIESSANWSAQLPKGFRTGEMLRPPEELNKEGLILHPGGYLEVRQSVLPFDRIIEKFGSAYVQEKPKFSISNSIKFGTKTISKENLEEIKENFAAGQYRDLNNAEKLSTPDFEEMTAGISFGNGYKSAFDLGTEMESINASEFESIVLDNFGIAKKETPPLGLGTDVFLQKRILSRSLNRKVFQAKPESRYQMVDDFPSVKSVKKFRIAHISNLSLPHLDDIKENSINETVFNTYGEASIYLKTQLETEKVVDYQVLEEF